MLTTLPTIYEYDQVDDRYMKHNDILSYIKVEDREAILDDREGRLAGPIVRCGRLVAHFFTF